MLGKNIIRFVVILFLQVLVFNHIHISGYVYPAFYVYFIMLLPFETAGWLLLSSAFLMGIGVDLFSNTLGLNAAAAVFTAFIRPGVIRLLKSKKEYEPGIVPGIAHLGFSWFFFYAVILIFLHHGVLFFLEVFSLNDPVQTLHRIIASSVATIILVLFTQLLFSRQDKK